MNKKIIKKRILNKEAITDLLEDNLTNAFVECLKDSWRSGIDDIVKNVISENKEAIADKYNRILKKALNGVGFEKAITTEFQHKVAKNMVAKLEGQVEQAVNVIRQDQTLRAKMIVAIENIIEENQPKNK